MAAVSTVNGCSLKGQGLFSGRPIMIKFFPRIPSSEVNPVYNSLGSKADKESQKVKLNIHVYGVQKFIMCRLSNSLHWHFMHRDAVINPYPINVIYIWTRFYTGDFAS
jgi:hypothetical protein